VPITSSDGASSTPEPRAGDLASNEDPSCLGFLPYVSIIREYLQLLVLRLILQETA
jgi:hypothetical protein